MFSIISNYKGPPVPCPPFLHSLPRLLTYFASVTPHEVGSVPGISKSEPCEPSSNVSAPLASKYKVKLYSFPQLIRYHLSLDSCNGSTLIFSQVDGRIVSEIGPGLLVLVGLHESDSDSDADYM